jgi:hypothetical protein
LPIQKVISLGGLLTILRFWYFSAGINASNSELTFSPIRYNFVATANATNKFKAIILLSLYSKYSKEFSSTDTQICRARLRIVFTIERQFFYLSKTFHKRFWEEILVINLKPYWK